MLLKFVKSPEIRRVQRFDISEFQKGIELVLLGCFKLSWTYKAFKQDTGGVDKHYQMDKIWRNFSAEDSFKGK